MHKSKSMFMILSAVLAISLYSNYVVAGGGKGTTIGSSEKKQERKKSNEDGSDSKSKSTSRVTPVTDDEEKPGLLARIFGLRKKSSPSAPDCIEQANNSPPPCADTITPRMTAPVVVHGSLCTLIMPIAVRVGGYLRVEEGATVTLMEAENLRPGHFIARNGVQQGMIMETALNLDQHTGNLYLELADTLVAHPELLARLLLDHPELATDIVDILAARRVLHLGLQALFEMELGETFRRGLATEIFRAETPALVLAGAIFNRPGMLQEFRRHFIEFAIARIEADYDPANPASLVIILEQCIDYLLSRPNESFPPELIVILRSLRLAAKPDICSLPVSVLLGSMLFLRFISPGLAQPDTLCALTASNATKEALRKLAKMLQLISSQIDPTEEHPLYSVLLRLRRLHQPVADLLNRIALRPTPLLLVEPSLIARAATIYGLMMRMDRESTNPEAVIALDELEARLGRAPEGPVEDDSEAPMSEEIRCILGKISSNCVKSRFPGL